MISGSLVSGDSLWWKAGVPSRLLNQIAGDHVPFIAVVDDDFSLRSSLVYLLQSFGYEAASYESGPEMLAATAGRPIACLVTDVQMPEMDGFQLVSAVHLIHPDLPVVMLTGCDDLSLDSTASARGVLCVLRKPMKVGELARWLDVATKNKPSC
jgi:FixJ family two-component response regulator